MNPHHVPGNPFAAKRVLAWHLAQQRNISARLRMRRGAGATDAYDPALQGVDQDFDPNLESGTGTKVPDTSGTALQAGAGSGLPAPNANVYGSAQVVATTTVNLRDKPSISGNVLAIEQPGTILTVVGQQQNGWLNVQDPNGVTGWIYSAYLGPAADAGTQQGVQQGQAALPSSTPSIVTGTAAGGSGLVGLALVGGAIVLAKFLL